MKELSVFVDESGDFGYFEYYEDKGDIIAWAKLPAPYTKE